MHPPEIPFARALFAQWCRARGTSLEPRSRPFTRGWEALLEEAGIVSSLDRGEAVRDAQALAAGGWVELRTARYRPRQVERIAIPLAAEPRWREAFGFVPDTDDEAARIRAYPWGARLGFLREMRVGLAFEDLQRIDAFLLEDGPARPLVPIKERSLGLFGDEKRLDALLGSALFAPGRLTLADLRCFLASEPLAWVRGPAAAASGPVLVLENAATWHSYVRWNRGAPRFSAVVYGGGNRFADGVSFLEESFRELGGARRVWYFGDLDPQGLRIPQWASVTASAIGLPGIEPHLWSYERLLALGVGREQPCEDDTPVAELERLAAWLGELAAPALAVLTTGHRLAQEHVGWEQLAGCP